MFILEIKGILLHFGPKTEGTLVVLLPKFKGKFYPIRSQNRRNRAKTHQAIARLLLLSP